MAVIIVKGIISNRIQLIVYRLENKFLDLKLKALEKLYSLTYSNKAQGIR